MAVSSNIIKTLLERDWVRIVGHRDVPGRPALYATTRQFLDYFGLKSLDELPSLGELQDIDSLSAKLVLEDIGSKAAEIDSVESLEEAPVDEQDEQDEEINSSLVASPELDLLGDVVGEPTEDHIDEDSESIVSESSASSMDEDNTILSAADSTEPPKNTEV